MKKFLLPLIISILLMTTSVFANGISVIVDGKAIDFSKYGSEPFIENGITMLPFRSVFESFGGDVDTSKFSSEKIIKYTNYNPDADGKNDTIIINQAKNMIYYDVFLEKENSRFDGSVGTNIPNINGRIYVQLRAVSELLGYDVDWNGNTKTITVNTDVSFDDSFVVYDDIVLNQKTTEELQREIDIKHYLDKYRTENGLSEFKTESDVTTFSTKIAKHLENKKTTSVILDDFQIEYELASLGVNDYHYLYANGMKTGEIFSKSLIESNYANILLKKDYEYIAIGTVGEGSNSFYFVILY